MVEKFEQNDELKRSFEINSVQSDEAIEIVSDEDKKEDPEPGRKLLEDVGGMRAERRIERAAAERCTFTLPR